MIGRALVLALLATFIGIDAAPGASADEAEASVTYVTMSGHRSDYVTDDQSYFWGLDDGTVTVSGSTEEIPGTTNAGYVVVHTSGGSSGGEFTLQFVAPAGQPLELGHYAGAGDFNADGPSISVGGNGRGCHTASGEFTVRELAPDLSRLWITYTQFCGTAGGVSSGEVKFNLPADPSGLETAPSRVAWPSVGARTSSEVPVRVQNLGAVPISVATPTVTNGSDAFTLVEHDCATLEVGAACHVLVRFAPALVGEYTADLTISDTTGSSVRVVPLVGSATRDPVRGRIASDRRVHAYGSTATVVASLEGSYVDPVVSVYVQPRGGDRELVTTSGVDELGRVVVTVPLKKSTKATMEWVDGSRRGTASTMLRVRSVSVTAKVLRASYRYGTVVPIRVLLRGAPPSNREVAVYRTVGDGPPVLVARQEIDPAGTEIPVVARTKATYSIEWADEGVVVAKDKVGFSVYARVTLAVSAYERKVGKEHQYRPGSRIQFRAAVAPRKPGQCTSVGLEVFAGGRWNSAGTTGCIRLSRASTARAYLVYDKALLGRRLRFRSAYGGDKLNYSGDSPWVYARYVR